MQVHALLSLSRGRNAGIFSCIKSSKNSCKTRIKVRTTPRAKTRAKLVQNPCKILLSYNTGCRSHSTVWNSQWRCCSVYCSVQLRNIHRLCISACLLPWRWHNAASFARQYTDRICNISAAYLQHICNMNCLYCLWSNTATGLQQNAATACCGISCAVCHGMYTAGMLQTSSMETAEKLKQCHAAPYGTIRHMTPYDTIRHHLTLGHTDFNEMLYNICNATGKIAGFGRKWPVKYVNSFDNPQSVW